MVEVCTYGTNRRWSEWWKSKALFVENRFQNFIELKLNPTREANPRMKNSKSSCILPTTLWLNLNSTVWFVGCSIDFHLSFTWKTHIDYIGIVYRREGKSFFLRMKVADVHSFPTARIKIMEKSERLGPRVQKGVSTAIQDYLFYVVYTL